MQDNRELHVVTDVLADVAVRVEEFAGGRLHHPAYAHVRVVEDRAEPDGHYSTLFMVVVSLRETQLIPRSVMTTLEPGHGCDGRRP